METTNTENFLTFVKTITVPITSRKGFRNRGNVCLWNQEFGSLESGIQLKEYGSQ